MRRAGRILRRERIRYGVGRCVLGRLVVAVGEEGVVGILIGERVGTLVKEWEERFAEAEVVRDERTCAGVVAAVAAFVNEPGRALGVEVAVRGTGFQRAVWREVGKIPMGETRTYAEVARAIGAAKAVRAVGSACRKNPLAVVIPCHRVIKSDGTSAAGFCGGAGRQRLLLEREGAGRGVGGGGAEG